jgi:hypothetical protein
MDILTILDQLRNELEAVNESILALERIQAGHQRRRGRPPAWLIAAKQAHTPEAPPARRGRRKVKTAEADGV